MKDVLRKKLDNLFLKTPNIHISGKKFIVYYEGYLNHKLAD